MKNNKLDLLTRQVENLKPDEQLLLIERIVALLRSQTTPHEEPVDSEDKTWDKAELQQLFSDNHPMTTQQIVEAGLFGGWEDIGIEDSLQWVQQQRSKAKDRYSW